MSFPLWEAMSLPSASLAVSCRMAVLPSSPVTSSEADWGAALPDTALRLPPGISFARGAIASVKASA